MALIYAQCTLVTIATILGKVKNFRKNKNYRKYFDFKFLTNLKPLLLELEFSVFLRPWLCLDLYLSRWVK